VLLAGSSHAAGPLWVLYLAPTIIAAAAGRAPAVAAAGLCVLAYAASIWIPAHALPAASLWPIAFLVAALLTAAALLPSGSPDLRDRRFWPEVAAAARGLGGLNEPHAIATLIVERAGRLTRADRAWLCWYESDGRIRPGPIWGDAAGPAPLPDALDAQTLRLLRQSPLPLSDITGASRSATGEAVALPCGEAGALLGIEWRRRRIRRAAWRSRLQAFAPWAAEALARAAVWETRHRQAVRDTALKQAALEWAAADNPIRTQETALRAVRTGLEAAAAVVDRASGGVLAGDPTLVASLAPEDRIGLSATSHEQAIAAAGAAPAVTMVRGGFALVCSRAADPFRAAGPFNKEELRWLEELSAGLGMALERCAAHALVETRAEQLRAAIEGCPAPMAVWEASGQLLVANATYTGLGLAPVLAGSALAGNDSSSNELAGGASSLQPGEFEVIAGEPERVFLATIVPIMGGSLIVGQYREVTREREALRAKGELIATVGHELRNPLTSIRGYGQMMARQLRIVQSQVTQLDALISDFVDASHRDVGELPLSRDRIDLCDIGRQAAERFRGAHDSTRLRLELGDPAYVDGDAARLGQVLDNLLNNAAKYSPSEATVTLRIGQEDEEARISVRDEGLGIAPEHLAVLFERFYRVPGPAETVKGLGLGLSIVRDLVAAHGGRVWAESDGEGLGSTFQVALPPAPSPEMAEMPASV